MSRSGTTTQGRRRGSNPRPLGLESSTLPLSHCAPSISQFKWIEESSRHTRAGSKVMQPMILNDTLRWDCIFVYFKLSKYHPFTDAQIFNFLIQSLKTFSWSFWGIPLRRFNMETPNFWREVYFCQQDFS